MHAFSRRLAEGPLLCDGAMGTMLYARGGAIDSCFDVLNLNDAALVKSVHADYVAAGADCLETNTFGANRFMLAAHGLEGRVHDINRAGARLARARRTGQRPMLDGRSAAELDALYRAREPFYARAHLTVDTAGQGIDQVVARILAALRDTHAARV